MRNLVMVLMMCGAAGPALAEQSATDVGNTGRFEFDGLPHLVSPGWNLNNLEYPAEAITIETIGEDNRGLRIGRPDASQTGRYTITLRGSTHDWDPTEIGTTHSVTVRMAAKYSGSAFVGVSIPGGGALLDLGGGDCTLWQRVGDTDQRVNETALVRQTLADWRADALHSYTLEWTPTGKPHDLPCRLLIDGKLIKEFRGRHVATIRHSKSASRTAREPGCSIRSRGTSTVAEQSRACSLSSSAACDNCFSTTSA